MKSHEFTLVIDGTDQDFYSVCQLMLGRDDAATKDGDEFRLMLSREASSLREAIRSAVDRADGFAWRVIRVEP